jgi:hypothetical protein
MSDMVQAGSHRALVVLWQPGDQEAFPCLPTVFANKLAEEKKKEYDLHGVAVVAQQHGHLPCFL